MLNMSFEKQIIINTEQLAWVQSPKKGVWRKPLAREEAEKGHATSIVRFDPGATFSNHDHPLGEEIFVLKGVFSDQTGDYKEGTYFRNPEGFLHAPFSKEGCTIFVKLHQFQQQDSSHLVIDTITGTWNTHKNGLMTQTLHEFDGERVELQKWPAAIEPTMPLTTSNNNSEELYIISGTISDDQDCYSSGTWIRRPQMTHYNTVSSKGALVLRKSGHLSIKR